MTNERWLWAFKSAGIQVIPSSQTKIAPQPEKVVENDVTFEILLGTGAMLVGRAREWGMVYMASFGRKKIQKNSRISPQDLGPGRYALAYDYPL